ncbi:MULTISPECIES: PepSY domain-containing protein [Bradyrhizobium]|uniref:PepSY domain-containing protein n=1 Tax=Bradyrhizobium TaxID=374 RepID=UPI000488483A|nr:MULTISPECIES: PepSY domain-containing protein [Bradyrhizobium]RZN31963.1 PepSY domain-containing protein [Bradyrhizobium sp. Leo121]
MKRTLLAVLATAVLSASPAIGQNPPAQSGPNNSAVNSSGQNNSSAPVAGRNSFTESQAKSRIEQAGYSNVTSLKKDDDGVWRAKANKGGSPTDVSLDFQGNVNSAK